MLADRRTIVVGTSYDGGGQARHLLTWGVPPNSDIGAIIDQMIPAIDARYIQTMKFIIALDPERFQPDIVITKDKNTD